jgi:hypothetical protein
MLWMSSFRQGSAACIPVRMKMTDEQPDFTAEDDDVGCLVGCQVGGRVTPLTVIKPAASL